MTLSWLGVFIFEFHCIYCCFRFFFIHVRIFRYRFFCPFKNCIACSFAMWFVFSCFLHLILSFNLNLNCFSLFPNMVERCISQWFIYIYKSAVWSMSFFGRLSSCSIKCHSIFGKIIFKNKISFLFLSVFAIDRNEWIETAWLLFYDCVDIQRGLNFGFSGTIVTVFNSLGDSGAPFACAAAVSQSVRRDINIRMSPCKAKRPDRVVWNLSKWKRMVIYFGPLLQSINKNYLKWIA